MNVFDYQKIAVTWQQIKSMSTPIDLFINLLDSSISDGRYIQLSLMNKRQKDQDIRSAVCRSINTKKGRQYNIVYRHTTKDITKNYSLEALRPIVRSMLEEDFSQGVLYTSTVDTHISFNKKNIARIKEKSPSKVVSENNNHDRTKTRLISPINNIYLRELGVSTINGEIRNNRQNKFKQINKYIEILDGIIKSIPTGDQVNIVDMGSGKGYLTFALYDYLKQHTSITANILGVEVRPELVKKSTEIAEACNFDRLNFKQGRIEDHITNQIDMLIALHACDTATDDAIHQGIVNNAAAIICAPCCHKQIRKQLNPVNILRKITHHGILKERQAEILTDTVRALILEAYGYKTQVFEFISIENTPKNVIISAVKRSDFKLIDRDKLMDVQALKKLFGIEQHYLESLLNN